MFENLLQHPGNYYNLFYLVAILSTVVIFVIEATKKNFPVFPFGISLATGLLLFMIGCHIITFSAKEWSLVFTYEHIPYSTGLSVIGGILLSVPFIYFFKHIYRFDARFLDAYAYILPVGMAIQRIGCFLAGCCFGSTTSGFLSVQYPSVFPAFQFQQANALIPITHSHALPVHPVQLYEALGCLLAAFLLYRFRNSFKTKGNLFYLAGLSYYVVRFFSEFFRETSARNIIGKNIFFLTNVQWLMLALALLSISIIYFREHRGEKKQYREQSLWKISIIHFIALVVCFAIVKRWLLPVEIFIFNYILILLAAVAVYQFYVRFFAVPAFNGVAAILSALCLLIMSQTTTEVSTTETEKPKVAETYYTISTGYLFGNFNGQVETGQEAVSGGCEPTNRIIYTKFEEKYSSSAFSLSKTWIKTDNNQYTVGLNSSFNKISEDVTVDNNFLSERKVEFSNFQPYFLFEGGLISVKAGAHLGRVYRIKTNFNDQDEPSIISKSTIYPSFALRVGRINRFFGTVSFLDNSIGGLPLNTIQVGFGFGFNSKKGSYLEFGHSSFSTLYIAPVIAVDQNVKFRTYLGLGGGMFNSIEDRDGFTGAIGLSVNFNRKKK